jgi:hypothetical protein
MKVQIAALLGAIAVLAFAIVYFSQTNGHLRGDTLAVALAVLADGKDPEKAAVARAIVGNYTETRQIAALWSGLYWGFAWAAAVLCVFHVIPDTHFKRSRTPVQSKPDSVSG